MDGVQVHYFPSDRLRRIYYSPRLRAFLEGAVAQADVTHTHSVFLWPTTVAARIARRTRRPYVLSPRGMLVQELVARRNSWLKKAWIAAFERANVEDANAVHVTSRVEAEELARIGLHARSVIEIPNGIPLATREPDRSSHDVALPAKYMLFLGRISWKKGLDRLIAALVEAPEVHLVVAGNDDENHWPVVHELSSRLGVAARVHRLGFVGGASKHRLIANARAMVLASYSENFGNAVLESMAMGVPAIVTPEVGLADEVRGNGAGRVVAGDARSLGAALAELWRDDRTRATLGANALKVARGYAWEAIAARFEHEYEKILSSCWSASPRSS
jgi:glycosyltransferase involved in cell wall biosynthesis